MPDSAPRFLDLRTQPRPDLLTAFIELYTDTFTDPSEREDPAQWPQRLYGEQDVPQPYMHLLVAVDTDSSSTTLLGGMAFEYYRESRCGLLTYLVVDPGQRRRGLARHLIQRAITLLKQDADAAGTTLRGVSSETEDPARATAGGNAMPPQQRLLTLAQLGARWLDIPYLQPALAGGSGRCRHLLLLVFYPGPTQPPRIDGSAVRDFLHEFYRALGIADPDQDAEFLAMTMQLSETVTLKSLQRT